MKSRNTKVDDSVLLAQYLCNEVKDNEKAELEQMIQSSPSKENIENLVSRWNQMKNISMPPEPNLQNAWQKLHIRFEADGLIPAKPIRVKSSALLLRIAAVSFVLLALGAVLVYNYTKHKKADYIAMSTQNIGETLVKTLADGSIVFLRGNTAFSFPSEFKNDLRDVRLKGEAFFEVKPDAEKPFVIETNLADIEVLGTAFNVKNFTQNDFELIVNHGKVKVTLKGGNNIEYVNAGEKVIVSKGVLVKTFGERPVQWYKKRLEFKDEALHDILETINLTRNSKFSTYNQDLAKRRLTIAFEDESVNTISELLCLALDMKSYENNGSIVFIENSRKAK